MVDVKIVKKVVVKDIVGFNYCCDDWEGPLFKLIVNLSKTLKELEADGWWDIEVYDDEKAADGDSYYSDHSFCLRGKRYETDSEYRKRLKKADRHKEQLKKQKEEQDKARHQLYLKLKKEFGPAGGRK